MADSMLTVGSPEFTSTTELETAETAATQRAARLWRFLAVTIVVWTYYSAYYFLRGYGEAALICFAEVVICTTFLARFWGLRKRYTLLMHGSLTLSAVGLFALSICRGSHLADTIYFIPCCIIIAAQLIGVWSALIWCLASIGITFLHFTWLDRTNEMSVDQLVNAVGFSATVFFLCQQAEHYYEKRTRSLLALGEKLRDQTTRMRKLANTDALTGLDNRLRLVKLLEQRTSEALKNETLLAALVLDLDGFKEINDAKGHAVGDTVLQIIATRLIRCLDNKGTVARLGGDEFFILLPEIASQVEAEEVANRIVQSIRVPIRIANEELLVDGSIGICIFPDMTEDASQLIVFADTAMFHAKSTLDRRMMYAKSMTDEVVYRRRMQEKLAHAIERDEFRLVFQPQVNIATKNVESVEALLRWNPDGKDISPLEFIPMLERNGEIIKVSRWIVEQCCRQICIWNQNGYRIRISINISALEFNDPGFVDTITQSINRFGVDPSQLEFEITESVLIQNVDETIDRLTRLKQLGASISIDDFGTGYSSLSYLKQFPIDRLKIDRAFVKDFPNADDGLLASSIIVLGQALEMRVIAEGVETQEQLNFLSQHGCDEYQGFLLSPPVSASECARFFDANTNVFV